MLRWQNSLGICWIRYDNRVIWGNSRSITEPVGWYTESSSLNTHAGEKGKVIDMMETCGIRCARGCDSVHNDPLPVRDAAPSLDETIACLGNRKVISIQSAAALWNTEVREISIPFRMATLKRCAEENSRFQSDWRCVYLNGFPLLELGERMGTDKSNQPCFSKSSWWKKPEAGQWTTMRYPRGYYLIDVRGRFYPRMNWFDQETEVRKLGQAFKRVPEALLAECAFSFFLATKERLLSGWYHWGPSEEKNGRKVHIGDFGEQGLELGTLPPAWKMNGTLRVCLIRRRDV